MRGALKNLVDSFKEVINTQCFFVLDVSEMMRVSDLHFNAEFLMWLDPSHFL